MTYVSLAILCRLSNMKHYIASSRFRICESSNDCFNVSYVNIQLKSAHTWNTVYTLLNVLPSGHLALHGKTHTYTHTCMHACMHATTHNTHLYVIAFVLDVLVTCTVASHPLSNSKHKLLQKSRYDHCPGGIKKTFLTKLWRNLKRYSSRWCCTMHSITPLIAMLKSIHHVPLPRSDTRASTSAPPTRPSRPPDTPSLVRVLKRLPCSILLKGPESSFTITKMHHCDCNEFHCMTKQVHRF